jgi:hypothetical protein
MPLITDKLIVGVEEIATPVASPPPPVIRQMTKEETNPRLSFGNFINLSAKQEEPAKVVKEVKKVTENIPLPADKYLKKRDGELVRHINRKSHYLRDVFEDF